MRNQRLLKNFGDFMNCLYQKGLTDHSEGATLNQTASKYEITQQSLLAWKKQFLENASQAFESSKMSSEYKKEIEELQATNDKLAKALGNTTIERDWADAA